MTNTMNNQQVVTNRNVGTNNLITAETMNLVKYFAPLLTSLGWVLGFTLGHIAFFEAFSLIIVAIGLIAAIICCPLKLIAFPFKCVSAGFTFCRGFIPIYGVADLCAAILGTIGGFVFGLSVVAFCPAIFTIKKYLENK